MMNVTVKNIPAAAYSLPFIVAVFDDECEFTFHSAHETKEEAIKVSKALGKEEEHILDQILCGGWIFETFNILKSMVEE